MISIVIPVYNSAEHLEKCLVSVAAQVYMSWECILVDDGSTDDSGAICYAWAAKDERFTVFHQHNQGVSAARNRGIEVARGEWLCFIDSDDWVDSIFLETLYSHTTETDLVISGQIREFHDGKTIVYQPDKTGTFPLNAQQTDTFVELNRRLLLYAPHEKLFRTDIIKEKRLSFPIGCQYGEDLVFNFQYLAHISKITMVNTALYHYTIGTETLSNKLRPNQFDEDYAQWHIIKDFYKCHGFWNNNAKTYLYKRLWGIVYDGIFLYPKLFDKGYHYIKHILAIPEVSELKTYSHVFNCAKWIKWGILNRCSWMFYSFFKVNSCGNG